MKIAISIPDKLFKRIERSVKRRRISRSQFFASSAEKALDEEEGSEVTKRINRFLEKNPGYDRIDPVMDALQTEVMRNVEWKEKRK